MRIVSVGHISKGDFANSVQMKRVISDFRLPSKTLVMRSSTVAFIQRSAAHKIPAGRKFLEGGAVNIPRKIMLPKHRNRDPKVPAVVGKSPVKQADEEIAILSNHESIA